jgi:hypothetical protein
MPLEFGLRAGLAQDFQYDQKINDLRYNEQLNKQAKLMAEKKAALFADDFDYNNAMNQHDNPLVKQFAQSKIKEIGAFVNQNPDWETNIAKRGQYKQLIRELKDNPDLNRGLQSDANYTAFQKDLAEKSKHPELFDAGAYTEVKKQWDNYIKYGNQMGEEAAKSQGKTAFVYQQPQDWADLNKDGMDYGSKFNDFEIKPLKGGGSGSYQEVPKEQSLNVLATDFYQRNKRQMDLRSRQAGYSDPIEYAKSLIRPGIKTKFDYGDINGDRQFALAFKKANDKENAPAGVWSKDVVGKDASYVNGAVLKEALGATPSFQVKNSNGTKFLDMTGQEVDYTGRTVFLGDDKKKGIKHFEVITRLTPEQAQEKGIMTNNFIMDDEVEATWKGKAVVKTMKNKKDEDVTYVEVRDFIPMDVNSATAQGIYDQKATSTKYVEAPKENYQKTQPKTVVQNGVMYTYNEQTGEYE